MADNPKLKILMLHGYGGSAATFRFSSAQIRNMLESCFPSAPKAGCFEGYEGGIELVYWDAPIRLASNPFLHRLRPANGIAGDLVTSHGWWRIGGGFNNQAGILWQSLATCLTLNGPFTGVIGLSQGAAVAVALASLLEVDRPSAFQTARLAPYPKEFLDSDGKQIHPPLKFAVSYCGLAIQDPFYKALFEPKVTTPTLCFAASNDTIIQPWLSENLASVFACTENESKERIRRFEGVHGLPRDEIELTVLYDFIANIITQRH